VDKAKGSLKNNFTFYTPMHLVHVLNADASRLAALQKLENIQIFPCFRALPDGRLTP
jgi:hypothetical protein